MLFKRIDRRIQNYLKVVIRNFRKNFKNNLFAIVLYGSWIKGRASKDSDIDLLIIFKRKNLMRQAHRLIDEIDLEKILVYFLHKISLDSIPGNYISLFNHGFHGFLTDLHG